MNLGYTPAAIEEVAKSSVDVMWDALSADKQEWLDGLLATAQIQYRYCHGDCDYFAAVAHLITGFPVVDVVYQGEGIHRLLAVGDRLMDASGWVSETDLKARYGLGSIEIERARSVTVSCVKALDDVDDDLEFIVQDVVDAILHLRTGLFGEFEWQQRAVRFLQTLRKQLESFNDGEVENIPCLVVE